MIVTGGAQLYVRYANGGIVPVGTAGTVSFKLEPGESAVPASVVHNYVSGLASASGCFSGTFGFQPLPEPDGNGWEPRVKWDRQ